MLKNYYNYYSILLLKFTECSEPTPNYEIMKPVQNPRSSFFPPQASNNNVETMYAKPSLLT